MPQTVTTLDNDTLDLVVHRTLGIVNDALLEETHELNPQIANFGATLPYGLKVTVPDRPEVVQSVTRQIKLYD